MQSRIIGIVLVVVGARGGVLASGSVWPPGGAASVRRLGFVLFSLPFLAVGLYFLLQSKGEIVQQTEVDKERAVLERGHHPGRVGVADLAIENNASRDEVQALHLRPDRQGSLHRLRQLGQG